MFPTTGIDHEEPECGWHPPEQLRPGVTGEELERRVRSRAYEIYLERQAGQWMGDAIQDWHQAEREIFRPRQTSPDA